MSLNGTIVIEKFQYGPSVGSLWRRSTMSTGMTVYHTPRVDSPGHVLGEECRDSFLLVLGERSGNFVPVLLGGATSGFVDAAWFHTAYLEKVQLVEEVRDEEVERRRA